MTFHEEILDRIKKTAKDIHQAGFDTSSGYGIITKDFLIQDDQKPIKKKPNDFWLLLIVLAIVITLSIILG